MQVMIVHHFDVFLKKKLKFCARRQDVIFIQQGLTILSVIMHKNMTYFLALGYVLQFVFTYTINLILPVSV